MLLSDLRYALRSLSRARGFTIAVVLTLGLGIGANTAIFSVVRGVLLKPLPHRDGDRLVYLRQSINGPGRREHRLLRPRDPRLPQRRQDARRHRRVLADDLHAPGRSRTRSRINVGLVTGNYFEVMGLSPVLGRLARRRRRRHRRPAGDGAHPRVLDEALRRRLSAIVGKHGARRTASR